MSQSAPPGQPKSRTAIIVIAVTLIGGAVIALLMHLRANERYEPRLSSGSLGASKEVAQIRLNQLSSPEVSQWILEKMKLTGARVGVVNLWATWCEPCRTEMPELVKFEKTGVAPLFLVSAGNEVDEPIVREFLSDKGVDFESALVRGDQQEFVENWRTLSSQDPARQWAMSLPATFIVDRSGNVLSFSIGTTAANELSGLVKKTLETLRATNRD